MPVLIVNARKRPVLEPRHNVPFRSAHQRDTKGPLTHYARNMDDCTRVRRLCSHLSGLQITPEWKATSPWIIAPKMRINIPHMRLGA